MADQPDTSRPHQTPAWLLVVAATWIVGFLWCFFDQPLHDPNLRRTDLWLMMILGTEDESSPTVLEPPSGLAFFPQRVPLFAYAALLLALAAAHGDAVCMILMRHLRIFRIERVVLCMGIGLAILSLVTLISGLAGQLNTGAIVIPSVISAVIAIAVRIRKRGQQQDAAELPQTVQRRSSRMLSCLVLIVLIPFAAWLLLGAVSPPTDFDVREYHLQGPKEWFLQNRITFLPHNVYTSFPFLSEMLCLAGMVICGDWWHGALVGQIVLACFQLLSTLCVFAIARRWLSPDAAWLAALICLTTPWTLRISLIAYAEGALTFYLIASTMTVLLTIANGSDGRLLFFCGLLAGNAMASKYTGLVSVVLPMAAVLGLNLWGNRSIRSVSSTPTPSSPVEWRSVTLAAGCYSLGVILMVAPWLMRNLAETGNPVYPLGYTIFGGREWSADMNARWKSAHSPSEHSLAEIPRHFLDAAVRNKWTSGLLFGLAVPALLICRRSKAVAILLGLSAWEMVTWWALTHRIDRFWIPVIPLLSVVGASTWSLSRSGIWRTSLGTMIAAATAFNLYFCHTTLVGYHVRLTDLDAARQQSIRADIRSLNRSISPNAKVLMVGDAEVFDATFPLAYSTVFDDCLFEEWTVDADDATTAAEQRRMLSPGQILANFRARGITHIHVHWGEILRYRLPGSYGFTEYVQPSRFHDLVHQNLLSPPRTLLMTSWPDLSDRERAEVESWTGFESLISDDTLALVQLFEVRSSDGTQL